MLMESVLLLIFMQIGLIVANKIIFSKLKNDISIKNRNISVGIVEFGLFIATGIIAYISFVGDGPFYSSIIYFLLGQILMVLIYYIYSMNIKFDLIDNLQKNHKDLV